MATLPIVSIGKARSVLGSETDVSRAETMYRPGAEDFQSRKPQAPSNEQNWEDKDLTPRVTFPMPADHWSCGLDP